MKRILIITVVVIAIVIPLYCAGVKAGEWSGFRGLSKQGRSDSARGPLHWSNEQNVLWKTPILGLGHSSPVVSENSIYLTTAYTTKQGQWLTSVGMRTRFFLMLFVVVASLFLLIKSCMIQLFEFRQIIWLSILLSMTILLAVGILFDSTLFDYERCVIRAWLGSSLIVNLCLLLSVFQLTKGSKLRSLIGVVAIFFAVLVGLGFPAKEHAFRNGPNLFIAIAAIILPLVTAKLIFRGHFFIPNEFAYEALTTSNGLTKMSLAKNLMIVISVSFVMLVTTVIIVTQVVPYSAYLSYHLANVSFKPTLGISSVYALLVVSSLAFAAFLLADIGWHKILDLVLLSACPYVVLFTALAAFIGTNYLTVSNVVVRAIVSIDRNSGHIKWVCEGLAGPKGQMHRYNSSATPTPVTDGDRVCAYFGTAGVMCADAEGTLLWTNKEVPFESVYGVGVSPVLNDSIVIIASGMPAAPYVCALDAKTGQQLWRREQPRNLGNVGGTSRTPLVHEINNSKVVLVWGGDAFRGFDLHSGDELWKYPTPRIAGDMVASITADGDTVYLPYPGWVDALSLSKLMRGENPVVWESVDGGANCSSPVLSNDILFTVSDDGIATGLDAKTGKLLWTETLDGDYYSSLVTVGQNVLFTNHAGLTTVVAAEPRFRKVAENDLGERIVASIVPVDGRVFIRSEDYFYCIQESP
jgi:outer membrane protein assembly factor BamB